MTIFSDALEDVGIEVVGTPIGSQAFCKYTVSNKIKSMLDRGNIVHLHPQAATKLLFSCVAAEPGYLSQVCHPSVTKRPLHVFDREVWKMLMTILAQYSEKEENLKWCEVGKTRHLKWLYLPTRLGGAGLRSWFSVADYAWFSSVAECSVLQDVDLARGLKFLKAECKEAHALAMVALGGATYVNHADFEFIPTQTTICTGKPI